MRAGTTSTVSHEHVDKDSSANLTPPQFGLGPLPPISAERERPREPPFEPEVLSYYHSNRRESAPSAPHLVPGSAVPMELPSTNNSPRRAVSETENHGHPRISGRVSDRPEGDAPDANQRLRQAIMDTVDHQARVAAAVQEKERGVERGEVPGVPPNQGPVSGAYDRDREADPDRDRHMVHV